MLFLQPRILYGFELLLLSIFVKLYLHLSTYYINNIAPPSSPRNAAEIASNLIVVLDASPVNCTGGDPLPVAEAIGTVDDPSSTKVDPLMTVVEVGLTPMIEAIALPMAPSTADEIAAFALEKGIVETPFTTTFPPVGLREYVVPPTVMGGPPGISVCVPRTAGADMMDDISASRLAAGIVDAPLTTTSLPEDAKEKTAPATVIGEPPGWIVCEPIATGVWLGTIAVRGIVEAPFTTTLLPEGSKDRTVPDTVIGEPPAESVCEPTTIGV